MKLKKTEELMIKGFNYRMIADVPVGVFLSGGLDSSLVAAIIQGQSSQKINTFTMLKLPSAFFTGVRVKKISKTSCTTCVKLKWINQNPFKSMFWAVQGMAAELSTGALVMASIRESNANVSASPTTMVTANAMVPGGPTTMLRAILWCLRAIRP